MTEEYSRTKARNLVRVENLAGRSCSSSGYGPDSSHQPGGSQTAVVVLISLSATGRDSIQAVMSLAFHLTAVSLTLTGRGNLPLRINL